VGGVHPLGATPSYPYATPGVVSEIGLRGQTIERIISIRSSSCSAHRCACTRQTYPAAQRATRCRVKIISCSRFRICHRRQPGNHVVRKASRLRSLRDSGQIVVQVVAVAGASRRTDVRLPLDGSGSSTSISLPNPSVQDCRNLPPHPYRARDKPTPNPEQSCELRPFEPIRAP